MDGWVASRDSAPWRPRLQFLQSNPTSQSPQAREAGDLVRLVKKDAPSSFRERVLRGVQGFDFRIGGVGRGGGGGKAPESKPHPTWQATSKAPEMLGLWFNRKPQNVLLGEPRHAGVRLGGFRVHVGLRCRESFRRDWGSFGALRRASAARRVTLRYFIRSSSRGRRGTTKTTGASLGIRKEYFLWGFLRFGIHEGYPTVGNPQILSGA